MPIASTIALIEAAQADTRAVLGFNISSLEMARAIIDAAERVQAPALLQFNRAGLAQIGGLGVAAAGVRALAAATATPLGLHLDHADTLEEIEAAIAAGFGSLMIDGSTLGFDAHVALARAAHERAAAAGRPLEAELGHVSGTEAGVTIAAESLTDPAEAARFVAATGVEWLAVSIGNAHGGPPPAQGLDFGRLRRVREAVTVPLVLHGASGVPAAQIAQAVRLGVAKINLGAGVQRAFAEGVSAAATADGDAGVRLRAGREALQRYAERLLRQPHVAR